MAEITKNDWFVPLICGKVLAPTREEVTSMAVGIFESQMKHTVTINDPDGCFSVPKDLAIGNTIMIRKPHSK